MKSNSDQHWVNNVAWYKYCTEYIDQLVNQIQEEEKHKFTNSTQANDEVLNLNSTGIENQLEPARDNLVKNPKLLNEIRQPVRTKATGQGGDALLNSGKDMPIYSDNFTSTTEWNSN